MKSILIKGSHLHKEKYKMYGSKNKGAPGSRIELNPMFKEINRLTKLLHYVFAVETRIVISC